MRGYAAAARFSGRGGTIRVGLSRRKPISRHASPYPPVCNPIPDPQNAGMTQSVIVVGLGAFGAAILYQLASRKVAAIGIDRFSPPHAMGSSHG
jgi:hypothetical protein